MNKNEMMEDMTRAAIRLATKEASVGKNNNMQPTSSSNGGGGGSSSSSSKKNVIAILPTGVEEVIVESMASSDNNNNSGGGGLFGIDLFGGKKDDEPFVPTTLMNAAGGGSSTIVIRYGELFGAPESSVSLERIMDIVEVVLHFFFISSNYLTTHFAMRMPPPHDHDHAPLLLSTSLDRHLVFIIYTARIITLYGWSKT